MWGNWLGWAISAVISLAAIFIGYRVHALGQPTLASGWVAQAVRPPSLDATARPVLPPMTDATTDAGTLYREAIADFAGHKSAYAAVGAAAKWDHDAADALKGFDDLVRAARCPTADVYAANPAEIVNYDQRIESLDALNDLARAAESAASNARLGHDPATAKAYATGVFALGLHLYDERLTFDELTSGVQLMSEGGGLLKQLAQADHDAAALAAIAAFDDARAQEFTTLIEPARQVLGDPRTPNVALHAGDFFALAADPSADRVWRVAAVRALGRLKVNNANRADGIRAARVTEAMAADPTLDHAVRVAAQAATKITTGEFHTTR